MAYLKPPGFTKRVFNPIAAKFGIGGAAPLTVAGRSTGETQTIPVIPVDVAGATYLVSTRGESEWVRNVRAAGEVLLRHKGATQAFRTTELPLADRDPVIDAYRAEAGKTVDTYWKQLPDASDHPVFRLDPAEDDPSS
jgi:hypothetical protein